MKKYDHFPDGFVSPGRGLPAAAYLPLLMKLEADPIQRPHARAMVSALCGVTQGALRTAACRARAGSVGYSGHLALPEQEEAALVGVCVAMALYKEPFKPDEFRQFVEAYTGRNFGLHFVHDFVGRHCDVLALRAARITTVQRTATDQVGEMERWVAQWDALRRRWPMSENTLLYYDEMRFGYRSDGDNCIVLAGRGDAKKKDIRGEVLGSMTAFISAAGRLYAIFYVFPFTSRSDRDGNEKAEAPAFIPCPQRGDLRAGRGDPHRFYMLSPTGYVRTIHHTLIMRKIAELWAVDHPEGLVATFLGDNLGVHRDALVLDHALRRGILLWFTVAHTSHYSSPLDALPFAVWQQKMHKAQKKVKLADMKPEERRAALMSIVYDIEGMAFTEDTIKGGFRMAHMYPFAGDKLITRAKQEAAAVMDFHGHPPERRAAAAVLKVMRRAEIARAARVGRVRRVHLQKGPRLYGAQEILEENRKRQGQVLKLEEEKAAKRARREEGRAQKEQLLAARKLLRAARTCQSEGCGRAWYKGRSWWACEQCHGKLCPRHKGESSGHTCPQKGV